MTDPAVAQKAPYGVELEPGTYWWCACGRSQTQPFCDGSHKNTDILPVKFEVTRKDEYHLCGCKQTGTPPFCDGTHNQL
jgi:CDGSH-type Zn-finger protein